MSWVLCVASSLAQYVQGRVTDAATGEPLPTAYVYYEGQTHTATQADLDGNYRIRYRKGKLVFSMMGFETKMVAAVFFYKICKTVGGYAVGNNRTALAGVESNL